MAEILNGALWTKNLFREGNARLQPIKTNHIAMEEDYNQKREALLVCSPGGHRQDQDLDGLIDYITM